MSHDGRASVANLPAIAAGKPAERDGTCAAGAFPQRTVGAKLAKPVDPIEREGLRRLIEHGKLIRRTDGSYGTKLRTVITNAVATRLKSRDLAVGGFDREIVPTEKGRRLHEESNNGS